MTAYGSGEVLSKEGRFSVQIQSVNRRFLEINIGMPSATPALEAKLRAMLQESLSRGQVQLTVNWQKEGELGIKPNLQLAQELKEGWEQIAAKLEIDQDFDLSLLKDEKLFVIPQQELNESALFEATETALDDLLQMRRSEGQKLAEDLQSRVNILKEAMANCSNEGVERFRQRLSERLESLVQGTEHEERILKEVAIFADKVDVTEEITRFNIHLEKFEEVMTKGGACGKKLDFLLQELVRESNTLGAKGQMVVEIKSELEKMREQVQNIE
ncbi:MAG: hypothetical protein S4CHLAM81_02300 [Chlamydiales bacterium]|nr:hypothetical protein [Chlamydiales bacterium]